MTSLTICDACGEQIEDGTDYVAAMVTVFSAPQGNQPVEAPAQGQLHWHPEHVPDGLAPYKPPEPEPKNEGRVQ